MLTIFISLALLILICLFYIIGLFNTKVAGQVDLILFTIINLELNKKNTKKAPKKIVKLAWILLYKRRLFAKKLEVRRLIKKLNRQKTR
jgi:hypothetical protein